MTEHYLDASELNRDVAELVRLARPYLEEHAEVADPRDSLGIAYRAIAIRQLECLEAATALVDAAQGYGAVIFLRPACEELIWTKYLKSLPAADAAEIIRMRVGIELKHTFDAQVEKFGTAANQGIGITIAHQTMLERYYNAARAALDSLGSRLRWRRDHRTGEWWPTTASLSRATGTDDLYKFLYHATSRFVHFSPVELLRRAWGSEKGVTISSNHFRNYWSYFALYWGTYFIRRYDSRDAICRQ